VNFRGVQWAAKRFYNIGDGAVQFVPLDDNQLELEKEGKRLAQTAHFLEHFGARADMYNVDIGNGT
jgi:hypothetical protein